MDKKQKKSNLSTEQRYERFNSLINRLKRLEGGEFRNTLSFYHKEGLVFVYDDKGKKLQEPNLDSHRGGLNDLLVGNMIIVDPRFTAGEIPDTEASIYKISGKPGDHKLTKTTFADYAVSCDKSIKKPQMESLVFLRENLTGYVTGRCKSLPVIAFSSGYAFLCNGCVGFQRGGGVLCFRCLKGVVNHDGVSAGA